jgi:hypothetical protein
MPVLGSSTESVDADIRANTAFWTARRAALLLRTARQSLDRAILADAGVLAALGVTSARFACLRIGAAAANTGAGTLFLLFILLVIALAALLRVGSSETMSSGDSAERQSKHCAARGALSHAACKSIESLCVHVLLLG